jgi:hypothetical protein
MEQKRKKWTVNEEVTPALIRFREKRKWQLALRRYIIEKKATYEYAPYFGLDIDSFRQWIELQFTGELNWNNFATKWQFDHIVPVAYFDFSIDNDLMLCWNFINLRVETIDDNKMRGNRVDVLAVKKYFEALHKKTGYDKCLQMIFKIESIEIVDIISTEVQEQFILQKQKDIDAFASFSVDDYARVNKGESLKDILLEKEMLKKFG